MMVELSRIMLISSFDKMFCTYLRTLNANCNPTPTPSRRRLKIDWTYYLLSLGYISGLYNDCIANLTEIVLDKLVKL